MIGLEKTIVTAVDSLNAERNMAFEALPDNPLVFQGTIPLDSENVRITINFSNGFPERFPVFKITEQRRFYPHVDENGTICLFDDSALIIRSDLPEQILIDAFDRARDILLIKKDSTEYKTEVAREFNAYWAQSAKWSIYTNLSPCKGNDYRELKCITVDGKSVLSDSKKESEYLLQNYFRKSISEAKETTCMLIRLRSFSVPPIQKSYSWKQLRTFIIKNVTSSQKKQFQRFLDKKLKILNRFIVLSIPSDNRDFYIGFWIHYSGRHYYKVEKCTNCRVEPIMTIPTDYSYMLKRVGENNDIQQKSVLLIGCGSIGGFIAANLCNCGITIIDILDKDYLSIDNVHRHILGYSDAVKNRNKADLLKEYLENQFPYVEIDSLNFQDRRAEIFLKEPQRLKNYDLVISVTGEPMINLEINRLLHNHNINTPFIVCFNEPYGIGGHTAVVNIAGGCLQCMYTDIISEERTSFRGSFVDAEQDFKKSISGCAGSYVEYSALDSQQTAIMTTHLALQVLRGECRKNTLVSWVGHSDKLVANGYRVSDYYNRIIDKQGGIIVRDIPNNQRCSVCKNRTTISY